MDEEHTALEQQLKSRKRMIELQLKQDPDDIRLAIEEEEVRRDLEKLVLQRIYGVRLSFDLIGDYEVQQEPHNH